MPNSPTFLSLFPDCPVEESDRAVLSGIHIQAARIDKTRRVMDVELSEPNGAADRGLLLRLERRLADYYDLRLVNMTVAGGRVDPAPAPQSPSTPAGAPPLPRGIVNRQPPIVNRKPSTAKKAKPALKWGKPPEGPPISMRELNERPGEAVIEGHVFAAETKTWRNGAGVTVTFDITDQTDSIRVICLLRQDKAQGLSGVKAGMRLRVGGRLELDDRDKSGGLVFRPDGLVSVPRSLREDNAAEGRRVELHLHTRMSAMDATTDIEAAVRAAARWGHAAVAVTDHGVLHAFPDAMAAQKRAAKDGMPVKLIYGCEGYLIEDEVKKGENKKGRLRSHHIILLARNQTGLFNLYKLVSLAHIEHFRNHPNIPKRLLEQCREGLIVGSACERGEVFSAIVAGKPAEELEQIAAFYDYLEIQPLCNNAFMLSNGMAKDYEQLRDFNRTVLQLGRKLDKPVAATGDVHFLEPEDEVYRRVLLAAKKMPDPDRSLPLYFKTTDEMLAEFAYLGPEEARRVVIDDPNAIAALCENITPVRKGEYFPKIDGSAEELRALSTQRAADLYGDDLPPILAERLRTELDAIIGKGYDIIYMIAQKLMERSLREGYLVGSRGSVGSSIVAFLAGITEVNALPPHYRCPGCKHWCFPTSPENSSQWSVVSDQKLSDQSPPSTDHCSLTTDHSGAAACGADLPDYACPVCGVPCVKDGFDIPFATFLGFEADKKPDIDLNFSGDYQARAHQHTVELFGEGKVFRAGTIGTLAQKTAAGYALKYLEERGRSASHAEVARLTNGCVGVKKTTGQHPGGLIIVPHDREIYEFCPVQYPADKSDDMVTTHFDFHAIEENLLKLDLLGHRDPTMLRFLEDLTGVRAQDIPLDDPDTLSLFSSPEALGLSPDPVLGQTGACALPEFGTRFVREMLTVTRPSAFDELVRISGLSHGTDVWLGNAAELIKSGTATLSKVICCRDDITLYLITKGLERKLAFTISEGVRKGRGLTAEWEAAMNAANVPKWYVESCRKIKYLFPKAHAAAYVLMAFRVAWFKTHRPLAFYAAWFSIRAGALDAAVMTHGPERVTARMEALSKLPDPTAAQEDELSTLEVFYEFYKRGFTFLPLDIMRSDPVRFRPEDGALRPPFVSLPGLGETAARDIETQRRIAPFLSVEDLSARCGKVSKTHVQQLTDEGAFGDLPSSTQLNLFDM